MYIEKELRFAGRHASAVERHLGARDWEKGDREFLWQV